MNIVKPHVQLVAETRLVQEGLQNYLNEVGAPTYWPKGHSDGESLVEVEGRMCYRSFEVGLNPNVTRIRKDHDEYIANILKSGHGSVLEHGTVSFIITCSRIATHELVRHRAGAAYSQESMRFVRLDDVPMWVPSCFEQDEDVQEFNRLHVAAFENFIHKVSEKYQLDNPETPFHIKKEITSAMRRWAPSGHMTTIGFTANFRALRHIIEMRTALGAEEEIRMIFAEIARICIRRYPAVFQDFEEVYSGGSEIPAFVPKYKKV